MITINDTTVAVETSAELKSILEADNKITLIYLANDITLAQGITILGTKSEVTIDGLYPTDGTGTIHTYTDMNSADSNNAIGVRTNSSIHVTVQNLNVVGKNYYGLIFVSESTAHQNVVITYKNLTYNGPQITYHPSGLSIYENLTVNIIDSTASVANEVGETAKIQIGGNTTIIHNSTGDSAFWFRGYSTSPSLEILENANVSITTTRDIIYSSGNYVGIIINKNASFSVKTRYGFFRNNSHQASNVLVDENSSFSVIQTQTNSSYATISCRGDFTVNKNATLYLEANYQNSAPLLLFSTSSSAFNINNPKSIILYNSTNACLSFSNTATFNINCGKLDYWLTSPSLISTGVLENNPLYSWYKSNEEDLSIVASVTSSKTTISSNNFTETELETLPALSLLTFQTAKTLRFIDFGNLELRNAPSKLEFQRPIVKTDPVILGRKDKTVTMSVVDSRAISTNWYLYAYIDAPLSTSNNSHTLPDSLVFIDDNQKITLLSKEPTLIYSGSPNEGTTKTTSISWSVDTGILFKINEPLYNGESYSTLINWILSSEILE